MAVNAGFEGDLIRPLGLVTLYSAYAEGALDDLLAALCGQRPLEEAMQGWWVGKKIAFARGQICDLRSEDLTALIGVLDEARSLFDQRNALVHGRLYSGGRLISNRSSVAARRVSPEEIVALADRIFSCKEQIWSHTQRSLLPMLKVLRSQGGT